MKGSDIMAGRRRKTEKEKLESLQILLASKLKEKEKIEGEIKKIKKDIEEVEKSISLKQANELKVVLNDYNISIKDLVEAIKSGNLNLTKGKNEEGEEGEVN